MATQTDTAPHTPPIARNLPDSMTTDQPDPSVYTWSTFFSIMTGHASPTDRARYFHHRDLLNEKPDCERVDADKRWLFKHSPIIRFLQSEIALLTPPVDPATSPSPANPGATIDEHNVRCRRCTTSQGGGFDPQYGILICANHMRNRGHLEDTLAHEMVHAYDHMRFVLDPFDLKHAACMEIRASTLSGECRFMREFWTRGQWKITGQLQECVRRRAALSVAQRPACRDDVQAAKVVNEVWESCFNDTRPFDEIYR
ncbi:Mitochondrial inner membrane protease atp23 [Saxophila tyrrhenica]|uniref:Mitochondrial inner membrane protease ATP23 n=1 Tax=Saxophila tyrrhenica TaxID=1690608 RepID=A0AAV9P7A1_9PEZI|nr:Mitochondrial inner membrane protease atp23 [Saxophila tyrrhenica]